GNGVSGLTLGSVGSGYIGAPYVDITGGGGSNATGYAVVDLNPASPTFGQLTGVVLSNPGVGYTNTPTINLLGGGGSGAGVTASGIVANTSGGLTKLGSGTLTLSGANTYTNGTTVSAGTLSFANTLAKPSVGTVNVLSNAALGLGVGGTGYFTSANVDALWANTLPGVNMDSNALVGIDTSASNFTYGTAQSTRGLVKLGANTLILTNANTYTGPTIISGGILQINTNSALGNGNVFNNATLAFNRSGAYSVTNPISGTGTNLLIGGGTLTPVRDDNLPITGAVTLGDTNSVGNLDLTSYSQTIAGLTVASTSSTLTNVLTIGAGQTLTVNGTGANFLLGGNVAATINTRLIATGGGALIITNGSYFESGRNNNANFGNAAIMDLSGLGAFTLSTTGTVHFGNDSGGTFSAGSTNVLAINNTISAAVLAVDQAGGSGTTRLLLGTGTNIFNVGALMVGSGTAAQSLRGHNAFLQFATNTGSILLRGPDGISAADMSIGIRRAQTCNSVVDFTGHYADLLIDTLDVGGINYSLVPGGQPTGSFAFDTGTAIVNQAQIGSLQNVSTNFGATGIVTIAGGYVAISNGVTMAINSGGVTTDARIVGYLNLYGGTINIGTNALGNSINMATGIGTNLAYVTITNGTVTLAGNIVKGGGANTNLASVTLNGGILDMTGHASGDAINPMDSLTLQSGTLQNLGQFNGGAPLVKTGAGTLLLSGANFYTGGTTISNGTLAVGVNNALPPNTTLYADNLGSILDLNGHNQQVSGLSGAVGYRGTVNDSVGSGSLTLNFASGTNVLAGSLSGATSRFTLTGGGTLLLTGTNGFGTTVVSNGSTYVVNGRNDGGVITVYSASQLKGSGTIGAAVSVLAGGTLQAGNSPGLLTFTNGLTLAADSTNVWQLLGNSNASGLRGATNGYSAINVTGGNLFITTGSKIQLVFNATDSTVNWNDAFWNSNQTWHFVDITGGGASTNNYAFGDLVSTWLDVGGQTLTVARPSATFGASLDGSGNVLINYNAIPDPCTASLLGLIGVAFLVRRLRRRAQG
ncbi:MAG: autotransporter-associated beta strand repeat-containing protein, partial [Kiritimatiellaeota bacterium]|nr:autotransporter-associated beta strand repeat-containing protein [Kiritimatiellota bacterium]